jgi:hypothetical protein
VFPSLLSELRRAQALANDGGGFWAAFPERLQDAFPELLLPDETNRDIRTLLFLPELFDRYSLACVHCGCGGGG